MLGLLALSIAALQGAALGQSPGPQAAGEKPPCAGLRIGSTPRGQDIVDDGYTLARWAFGRDQDAPITVAISTFYAQFGTDGTHLPLKAVYVNATSAPGGGPQLLQPRVTGSLAAAKPYLTNTSTALQVEYNCLNAVVWSTIVIDKAVTKEVCGRASATDLTLHFLWHKFCAAAKQRRETFALGTQPGSGNVVMGGEVQDAWHPGAHTTVVSSAMTSTMFYASVTDGKPLVLAPPELQGIVSTNLHAAVSGDAGKGAVLSSRPTSFEVTFACQPHMPPSQNAMTMVLYLCDGDKVKPAECKASQAMKYQPLTIQWVKNCIEDPAGTSVFSSLLFLILLGTTLFCGCGGAYKFHYMHARGLDVVPGVDALRACVYDFTDFLMLGQRSRESVRYEQAYMSEEESLNAASGARSAYNANALLDDDDVLVGKSGGDYGSA